MNGIASTLRFRQIGVPHGETTFDVARSASEQIRDDGGVVD